MRISTLVISVLLVALCILGVGAWRILKEDPTPPIPSPAATPSVNEPPRETPPPPALPAPPRSPTPTNAPTNADNAAVEPQAPPAVSAPPAFVWEERLEALMDSNLSDLEISRHLLALWPHLNRTNQVEAAQYLADFTPDEAYSTLVPILTNPATEGEAVDEFMTDLLNRPDALQLPLFLDIAKTPGHPRQETALEYLDLYLENDYGQDWAQWEQAVQRYLKENPELE